MNDFEFHDVVYGKNPFNMYINSDEFIQFLLNYKRNFDYNPNCKTEQFILDDLIREFTISRDGKVNEYSGKEKRVIDFDFI